MSSGAAGSSGTRADVRAEIARLRDDRNRSTVTSRLVATGLPYSSKEIAPIMDTFADEGLLTRWGNSTPQTYMIDFPAGDTTD